MCKRLLASILILATTISFSFEAAIYGVGGEINNMDSHDVAGTKGYYGIGTQFSILQEYLGEYSQINFGYVHESFWFETQAGVFVGKEVSFLYPRIGVGTSYMTVNQKRMKIEDIHYYVRQHNVDGFLKFQGIILKRLLIEWEGKFNTSPVWNVKIGLRSEF